jgi:hypothetical protein
MAACGDPAQDQRQSYMGANIKCHSIHMAIMVKVHRVVLSQDNYKALQAEAMVRQSSIQVVMDSIITSNISQKAREILKTLDTLEHMEQKTVGVIEHMDKSTTKPKKL